MSEFLKQETEIIPVNDGTSDRWKEAGYEAGHLLCQQLYAEGIKPQDNFQRHVSLNGWYDDLVRGLPSNSRNFSGFVNGVYAAWDDIKAGIRL